MTAEGKSIASRNSTSHGCTAKLVIQCGRLTPESEARLVLPDESRTEWEILLEKWWREYQPETEADQDLVAHAAIADWIMRRTARRYDDAENGLYQTQPDATLWSHDEHALLERFLRYQARAERTFYRARNTLELLRLERKKDAASLSPAANVTAPPEQSSEAASEPVVKSPTRQLTSSLIQCVTIRVVDQKTITLFQPRSEVFAQLIQSAAEPKPIVKRALYFLEDIPAEYAWITEYENHEGRPHLVIERTCEQALQDLQREQLNGSGHLLPAA